MVLFRSVTAFAETFASSGNVLRTGYLLLSPTPLLSRFRISFASPRQSRLRFEFTARLCARYKYTYYYLIPYPQDSRLVRGVLVILRHSHPRAAF